MGGQVHSVSQGSPSLPTTPLGYLRREGVQSPVNLTMEQRNRGDSVCSSAAWSRGEGSRQGQEAKGTHQSAPCGLRARLPGIPWPDVNRGEPATTPGQAGQAFGSRTRQWPAALMREDAL